MSDVNVDEFTISSWGSLLLQIASAPPRSASFVEFFSFPIILQFLCSQSCLVAKATPLVLWVRKLALHHIFQNVNRAVCAFVVISGGLLAQFTPGISMWLMLKTAWKTRIDWSVDCSGIKIWTPHYDTHPLIIISLWAWQHKITITKANLKLKLSYKISHEWTRKIK